MKQNKRLFQMALATQTYKKKKIPVALRNQVWISRMGEIFSAKCPTTWCKNRITPFTFEAGHNIPESKGGLTVLENLIPICSTCNKSMGNTHTFDTWCLQYTIAEPSKKEVPDVGSSSWRCC